MDRRRWISALVAAVFAVFLWFVYQQRFEMEASGGERVKVLVATRPIDPGSSVTEDAIAVREVPQAYVEDRAVRAIERPKVLGLRMLNGLQPEQSLMWTDIVTTDEDKRELSALVPAGSRAVSIRTPADDASSALIRPGDYVDVIGVIGQSSAGHDTRASMVLLQRVLVLATGLRTGTTDDTRSKNSGFTGEFDNVLTLSLTLPEAQMLSLTAEKGRLTIALRNPADPRTFERLPELPASTLGDTDRREAIRSVRHGGAMVARPTAAPAEPESPPAQPAEAE